MIHIAKYSLLELFHVTVLNLSFHDIFGFNNNQLSFEHIALLHQLLYSYLCSFHFLLHLEILPDLVLVIIKFLPQFHDLTILSSFLMEHSLIILQRNSCSVARLLLNSATFNHFQLSAELAKHRLSLSIFLFPL